MMCSEIICKDLPRAMNTASEGSLFKFAERELIFSMAFSFEESTLLEFYCSCDDLDPTS